jgi:dihydrolipoamide dehydrogenase
MSSKLKKISILLFIIIVFYLSQKYKLSEYLNFEYLKQNKENLTKLYLSNQLQFISYYSLIYIFSTAISIPGATILTIAAGFLFGLPLGVVIVSFCSTIGASLSFLFSRYLFKDYFEKKFSSQLNSINQGIEKDGIFYLFSLRMIPAFPFFLINILMGLTSMKLVHYFFISQIGMLLGTIVYVNAGTQLSNIQSLKDIASPTLLISFSLLGILPLLTKFIISKFKQKKLYSKFQKPKQFEYNLVVIGAGAGGLVTSYIAATVKAKVAIIEKHKMGGDCLNYGCVPSKTLISTAKKIHLQKDFKNFGIKSVKIDFDFKEIMKRITSVIKKIEPNDSIERYTKLGVDCYTGQAKILSPYEVQINDKILTTKSIVLATGAEPFIPPIEGIDKIKYHTSETIWNLKEQPKKLLIVGGGPIGVELSQAFSRLGTQVSLLEAGTKILSKEDDDVSESMLKILKEEGVNILTSHKLIRFHKNKKEQIAICESDSKEISLSFDICLFAIGRKPRTKNFGLEELGVELNPNGTIKVNEYLETNYPNIFACGDVAGPYQFTHTASHQAWYASVNALFGIIKKFKADYRIIPWTTFTDPEIAHVGLSVQEAKEKNIEHEIFKYEFSELDRSIADGETKGFIKVITEFGSDKILGVTILGSNAGELIAEFVIAMKNNIGLNKILGTIHSYPTKVEANKFVAGVWKKAHKPEKLLNYVEKFHTWRRN